MAFDAIMIREKKGDFSLPPLAIDQVSDIKPW